MAMLLEAKKIKFAVTSRDENFLYILHPMYEHFYTRAVYITLHYIIGPFSCN